MSKEMREQINKVKNFGQFLNENIIKTITKKGYEYKISDEEIKPNDYIVIFGHYMGGNHITKVREINENGIVVIEGGTHSFKVCRKIVWTNNPDIEVGG
jgi:hypothetical protein